MNTRDNDPLHVAINAKLAEVVTALPTPPAWYDGWMRLGPESTEEERLRVYQAIRDSRVLPEDAGFHLVAWQIDAITSQEAEISLSHLDEQIMAIEESLGLEEGESLSPGEAPNEYKVACHKYQDAWDGIFAEKLEEHGEYAMAQQFRADPDVFEERSDVGRQYFHGTAHGPEPWEKELFDAAIAKITIAEGWQIAGFNFPVELEDESETWVFVLYPEQLEEDGEKENDEMIPASGFSVNLEGLAVLVRPGRQLLLGDPR